MKKLVLLAFFIGFATLSYAQDYTDIVKFQYNRATLGNIDNDDETEVGNANLETYFVIPATPKTIFIAGFTYENTRLGLDHDDDFRTNLVMTRLNLGVKLDHGNGWSGTYVLLPKYASDFDDLGGDAFQFGGLALFEKKISGRKGWKFGSYVSSENFGTIITPLVGMWYKSPNRKFYVNAVFPIRSEANYAISDIFSVGANLLTSVKAYDLSGNADGFYVQEESIRFNLYAGVSLFNGTLLARAKIGYDTTDYGVYLQGDTVGAQILTFQVGGDDRNRQNREFDAAPFMGVDLVLRAGI
jgi:hypothetical protein